MLNMLFLRQLAPFLPVENILSCLIKPIFAKSEYDQEISHSQTADKPTCWSDCEAQDVLYICCQTWLNPPVTFLLTVPRRCFFCGSFLLLRPQGVSVLPWSLKIIHSSPRLPVNNSLVSLKVFAFAPQIPKNSSASPQIPQNISQFRIKSHT